MRSWSCPAKRAGKRRYFDLCNDVVWRGRFGQSVAGLAADGNFNGIVDAGDYTIWRDHATLPDAGASSDGAVPEPSSLILLAMAGVTIFLHRSRSR